MSIFNRIKEVVRTIKFTASPRLYGRTSTGAGEGQEITVGTGLTLSAGSLTVNFGAVAAASHTHTAAQITDFISALATSPPKAISFIFENGTFGLISVSAETPTQNGKPAYNQSSTRYCRWVIPELPALPYWEIRTGGTRIYRSEENVNSPDLVSTWNQVSGSTLGIEVLSADTVTSKSCQAAGCIMLPLSEFEDDAAAAAGGVLIGNLYYNSAGTVLCRIS